MSELKTSEHEGAESMADWGRRLVRASEEIPREALGFLGLPTRRHRRGPPQGSTPGDMVLPQDAPEPVVRVMSYDNGELDEILVSDVSSLRDIVARAGRTVWIDVAGFGNRQTREQIRELLDIHPLAMADVMHVPQRP